MIPPLFFALQKYACAASYDSCSNCMGNCSTGCGNSGVYPDAQAGCSMLCDTKACQNDCYAGCGGEGCGGNCKNNCGNGACAGGCMRGCAGLATTIIFYITFNTIMIS